MRGRGLLDEATIARPRLAGLTLACLAAVACARGDPPNDSSLAAADSIVSAWVDDGPLPGAVLLVAREGRVVFETEYGFARIVQGADPTPMTTEAAFDVASVTKVMATTMAVMLLTDRGDVDIEAPVSTYLPDFVGGGKEEITLRLLLTHRSGLPQWQPIYYHAETSAEAYAYLRELPLDWPVGEGRHYSDLGFMLLGSVVEKVSGKRLDDFLREELYTPLGLIRTGFRPSDASGTGIGPSPETLIAATSRGNPFEYRMVHDPDFGYRIDGDPNAWDGWRDRALQGEVNDGNAFHAFGGVAGHAGLFSSAAELGVLLQLLLDGGVYEGRRHLSADVVDVFLTSTGDGQALGWQLPGYAPATSFGHTGFTGTFVLGVRDRGLSVVLLTNRQHRGVDANTEYPDIGALQQEVTEALTRGGA